jgi:hypothetical protein
MNDVHPFKSNPHKRTLNHTLIMLPVSHGPQQNTKELPPLPNNFRQSI